MVSWEMPRCRKMSARLFSKHLDARDYEFNITNKVAGGDPAPGVKKESAPAQI